MNRLSTSRFSSVFAITAIALMLGGCPRVPSPQLPESQLQAPPVEPTLPAPFPPQDLVGRWGLAAYHKEEDRARIEAAAVQQCRQPYVIELGPTGGVMMHLADQATLIELRLKGARNGKTYIGLPDQPPGSMQDREFVVFTGREMILRWVDPEVQGRYGTSVYIRCAERTPRSANPKSAAARPKSVAHAKPEPAA